MLKKILFLLCFCSCNLYSQSFQNVVCSTGSFSSGFVYYNLGEALTATLVQNPLILTQGFIQPPDTIIHDIILSANEKNEGTIEAVTYPNPFSDNITLQIRDMDSQNSSIQMVDVLGRIVPVTFQVENISSNAQKYSINTSSVQEGNYFIRVIVKRQTVKVIKIIKL